MKARKGFIYKDEYGHIKGYEISNNIWFVTEFVIYPKHRRKGLGHILANKLPAKSFLYAHPLLNMRGPHIPLENLMKFYESLGFVRAPKEHEYSPDLMIRVDNKKDFDYIWSIQPQNKED